MTIYSLMRKVHPLRFYVILAVKSYREHRNYYDVYEGNALASLATLVDVHYISVVEYSDLSEQLCHVFRMYKRH